jgi:hypothetical protein
MLSQIYLQERCIGHDSWMEAILEHQRQQCTSWFETWQPFAALYHGSINWNIGWKAAWSHDFKNPYCFVTLQTEKHGSNLIVCQVQYLLSVIMQWIFSLAPNQHEPFPVQKNWWCSLWSAVAYFKFSATNSKCELKKRKDKCAIKFVTQN